MPYCLRKREPLATAVRRIACEQLDHGRAELRDAQRDPPQLDPHEAVHQIRKRCKKLRAVLRLARPALEAIYHAENVFFRDLAGDLSAVRDAQSILDCFDQLLQHEPAADARARLRTHLLDRRHQIAHSQLPLGERLAEMENQLRAARQRAKAWPMADHGFSAVLAGIKKSYAQARRAMKSVPHTHSPAAAPDSAAADALWHELRKQIKYHWYHMRLLRRIRPRLAQARRRAAHGLGNQLGDDHDLSLLRHILTSDPRLLGGADELTSCLSLIDRRRDQLHRAALPAAQRLFEEKPHHFSRRFGK